MERGVTWFTLSIGACIHRSQIFLIQLPFAVLRSHWFFTSCSINSAILTVRELKLKLTVSMAGNKHLSGALLLLGALAMVHHVSARDHVVGSDMGWNTDVNYTKWVNKQTFVLLDWISFRYQKEQHNVVQVNQSGYDNCTTDNAIGNWSSGKDFLFLNESKRYYYIDGRGGCYGGMKLTFFVQSPAPPPHHSLAENATTKSGGPDPGCELRPVGLTVSGLLMLAGALFGF